ncbi:MULTISPECIES: DUF485 domain-containing protein [unclassified Cupriavidus]|uniref:DUF485 domain-containing protein n=1 Tax=unclassified Cupriavidus TaxID=2640874 RepID=UPI00041E3A09|nr:MULTISPECIES: DUF485 domain-containing protein [unclassified Cupriavidus]MBP0632170.1 DUF485 domain-containing protein [Cupriavidus sp. AcVe19-1a]MBP0638049.1 DUF485 domain-containing protein [Cupriavidus sp. AcVe19-6a]
MSHKSAYSIIGEHPLFEELVRRRRRLVVLLSAVTLVPYYLFILVAALRPDILAARVSALSSVSVGWLVGVLIILGAWLLTGLYVSRANNEFDGLTSKLVGEAAK